MERVCRDGRFFAQVLSDRQQPEVVLGKQAASTTQSSVYRRFGPAFTGTRPTLKPGDPGIDKVWLRRRGWGAAFAAAWCVSLPILCGLGLFSAWGPFGWIDAWQLALFGSNSTILLMIPVLPLVLLPVVIARPARIDASTPFLLGIRQSFDPAWGPLIDRGPTVRRSRLRVALFVSKSVAATGAAVLAAFAWKAVHDIETPHAPLGEMSYARLVDPAVSLPAAVRVVDVVADRSRAWSHDYSVRQDVHHDVYFALRPAGNAAQGPIALLELDRTSPQYQEAPWNRVDAPGPREGVPRRLDDWTARQLSQAGFRLAAHVVVLEREQLHGKHPDPDPINDGLYALFGFIGLAMGVLFWWSARRFERT